MTLAAWKSSANLMRRIPLDCWRQKSYCSGFKTKWRVAIEYSRYRQLFRAFAMVGSKKMARDEQEFCVLVRMWESAACSHGDGKDGVRKGNFNNVGERRVISGTMSVNRRKIMGPSAKVEILDQKEHRLLLHSKWRESGTSWYQKSRKTKLKAPDEYNSIE